MNIRAKHGSPGNIRVTLHADDSSKPASTALATLSGSNPTGSREYDFTCANCYLTPNTTYWLVLAAPNANTSANNMYTWNLTSSNSETPGPSGSGWTIADNYKYRGASDGAHCRNDWCTPSGTARPAMFQVAATINPVAAPHNVLVGKPPDWSEPGKVKHTVTWSKPSGGTGSFSYELQCSTYNNPTASQWTDCGTKTVPADVEHERFARRQPRHQLHAEDDAREGEAERRVQPMDRGGYLLQRRLRGCFRSAW